MSADLRAAAETQWSRWWDAILDPFVHLGDQEGPDDEARMRRLNAEMEALYDPPEFARFADRAALREALRVTSRAAHDWTNVRRQALLCPPNGRLAQFDYDLVRKAAEQTAARFAVGLDAVRGTASVVPVRGIWWALRAPQTLICSVHAARDPQVARAMLAAAFESGFHS